MLEALTCLIYLRQLIFKLLLHHAVQAIQQHATGVEEQQPDAGEALEEALRCVASLAAAPSGMEALLACGLAPARCLGLVLSVLGLERIDEPGAPANVLCCWHAA